MPTPTTSPLSQRSGSVTSENAMLPYSAVYVAFCCHPLLSLLFCGLANKENGAAGTVTETTRCHCTWLVAQPHKDGETILEAGCGKQPDHHEYNALVYHDYGSTTGESKVETPKKN